MKESHLLMMICAFTAGVCAMGLAYDLNMDCKPAAAPQVVSMPIAPAPGAAEACAHWLATGIGGWQCG